MSRKLRMVDIRCTACTFIGENLVDLGAEPPAPRCPECGASAEVLRTLGAPGVMEAAYPDGKKRWTDEKIWSKLDVARVNTDWRSPERKKIEAEMKKVRRVKSEGTK